MPPCGTKCDKKDTCNILGQCLLSLKIVIDNQNLLNALKGSHTPKQVLILFRDHHITPMKSYYYHTKYWNGKEKGKEAQ